MDALTKLKLTAVPDTEWVKDAEYRQENRYWLRVSGTIALAVLRTLREKGITQREFAGLMGCSPQYISKIVKGSENLTLETICKMEKVLQIKLIETPFSHLHDEKHSSQAGQ
ncbi:helix-turn-helix domain-containing protein [Dyadobacter fermentans]|uniref:Plasmid maintenance system antidote protein, XRE family n=1 Tax=Dyadobacter fermentans (strain ATCC 700827 / DSM 18053 / CIP 107007 / KCTC 52180 / NS114) TaxID=471854 RepID=C6VYE1_DYAFD|nr:helix-turn-helix transcriptional regulator [Dyadobacter fermentans]ACT91620.1 plasmid maintenance system antidote protein, XRE family [Dyadobacter fermentans DSM 18053]